MVFGLGLASSVRRVGCNRFSSRPPILRFIAPLSGHRTITNPYYGLLCLISTPATNSDTTPSRFLRCSCSISSTRGLPPREWSVRLQAVPHPGGQLTASVSFPARPLNSTSIFDVDGHSPSINTPWLAPPASGFTNGQKPTSKMTQINIFRGFIRNHGYRTP